MTITFHSNSFIIWPKIYLLSLECTSCVSVANEMHGSLRENKAHDLDLKLIPWKHASEMFAPWSSIVPPSTVPESGRGKRIVDKCRPATCANTFCQCLWCWASCTIHAECWLFGAEKQNIHNFINVYILKLSWRLYFYSMIVYQLCNMVLLLVL